MLATLSFEDRVKQYFSDYEAYLENQKSRLPCLNIESSQGKQTVEVFFDDSLVKKMLRKPKQFKKPVKALRYGYVGNRKGLNGIRDVHANDGNIHKLVTSALDSNEGMEIMQRYSLDRNRIRPVKVVAHDTSGRRIYGFMDLNQAKVVLFGIGYY